MKLYLDASVFVGPDLFSFLTDDSGGLRAWDTSLLREVLRTKDGSCWYCFE